MGKIKGWTKTGKYYYRNENNNALIQIGQPPNRDRWKVYMEIPKRRKFRPIHEGIFYTDKEARKFAIAYMRKHPRG